MRGGAVMEGKLYGFCARPPYFDGAQPLELHLMFYALPVPMESDAFSDFFCRVRDRLHRDVYGVAPGRYV